MAVLKLSIRRWQLTVKANVIEGWVAFVKNSKSRRTERIVNALGGKRLGEMLFSSRAFFIFGFHLVFRRLSLRLFICLFVVAIFFILIVCP